VTIEQVASSFRQIAASRRRAVAWSLPQQLALTLLLLAACLAFFEITNVDISIQNLFYDFQNRTWLIPTHNRFYQHWFHEEPRQVAFVIAGEILIVLVASFFYDRLRPYRYRLLALYLAIALAPALIGFLKHQTHIYCPCQTVAYNGHEPYVKTLERYPKGFVRTETARCFPAGHATTGFMFMALFFFFRDSRRKWLGLAAGLSLGWLLGLFQMARGEHFLSHTIVTMLLTWAVILIVQMMVRRIESAFPVSPPAVPTAGAQAF
jgi:membrane-associated PAP2 superfamily phosphatase